MPRRPAGKPTSSDSSARAAAGLDHLDRREAERAGRLEVDAEVVQVGAVGGLDRPADGVGEPGQRPPVDLRLGLAHALDRRLHDRVEERRAARPAPRSAPSAPRCSTAAPAAARRPAAGAPPRPSPAAARRAAPRAPARPPPGGPAASGLRLEGGREPGDVQFVALEPRPRVGVRDRSSSARRISPSGRPASASYAANAVIGLSVSTPPRSKTTAVTVTVPPPRPARRRSPAGRRCAATISSAHRSSAVTIARSSSCGQPVVGEDVEVTAGPARLVVVEGALGVHPDPVALDHLGGQHPLEHRGVGDQRPDHPARAVPQDDEVQPRVDDDARTAAASRRRRARPARARAPAARRRRRRPAAPPSSAAPARLTRTAKLARGSGPLIACAAWSARRRAAAAPSPTAGPRRGRRSARRRRGRRRVCGSSTRPAAQGVVQQDDAVRPHPRVQLLDVGRVAGLVRVDEREVEGLVRRAAPAAWAARRRAAARSGRPDPARSQYRRATAVHSALRSRQSSDPSSGRPRAMQRAENPVNVPISIARRARRAPG